jgi:hypothetical protein
MPRLHHVADEPEERQETIGLRLQTPPPVTAAHPLGVVAVDPDGSSERLAQIGRVAGMVIVAMRQDDQPKVARSAAGRFDGMVDARSVAGQSGIHEHEPIPGAQQIAVRHVE